MKDTSLHNRRKEYMRDELKESLMASDPFILTSKWLEEALNAGLHEPNAMALASVSPDGMPSVRMLLLKEVNDNGFVFFSHYGSRKGQHLEHNPKAALLFFWEGLERQLRVEGKVEKLDRGLSDEYFNSRPYPSKISALTSAQSRVVKDREVLIEAWERNKLAHPEPGPNRPDFWGGYVLKPSLFEFWQGRENRFHDRIQYRLEKAIWLMERLAP